MKNRASKTAELEAFLVDSMGFNCYQNSTGKSFIPKCKCNKCTGEFINVNIARLSPKGVKTPNVNNSKIPLSRKRKAQKRLYTLIYSNGNNNCIVYPNIWSLFQVHKTTAPNCFLELLLTNISIPLSASHKSLRHHHTCNWCTNFCQ